MKLDPLATYRIESEPYYCAVHDEVQLFSAAYAARLPLMLKGPTGCGKTRFIEHMAHQLGLPLITVACHEDMTASDLLGRFLLDAEGTLVREIPLRRPGLAQVTRAGRRVLLGHVIEHQHPV